MIVVIMALVAGLGWAFWPRALPVEEAVVDMGPLQQTIDDEGRTRLREPYLIAAPVSGRLLRVMLKSGAPVVADKTIVAQMKPANATPLDTRALAEAKAGVIASEAALRQAHSAARQATESQKLTAVELKRTQQLFASHSVSQQALDQARTADAVAVSVLRAAQDMVAQREAELTRARAALTSSDAPSSADSPLLDIRAPVSGRVLRVLQQSATPITAGTAIMEIGDPEQDLEVVVPLRSEDAVQVSPGDPVQIERWGGPDVLHGVVERIDPRGYTKVSALGVEEKRVDVTVRLLDPPDARRGLGDD
jgi:HlyD family secretion protein